MGTIIKCEVCGKKFDIDKEYKICPRCGAYNSFKENNNSKNIKDIVEDIKIEASSNGFSKEEKDAFFGKSNIEKEAEQTKKELEKKDEEFEKIREKGKQLFAIFFIIFIALPIFSQAMLSIFVIILSSIFD